MIKLEKDQIVLLLFRVKLGDENDPDIISNYVTIGRLFKVNNSSNDFENLSETLIELLSIKDESYKNQPVLELAFTYKIVGLDNEKILKKNL